jgi:hypothetical protein
MTITDSVNLLLLYFLDNSTLKFSDIEKLVPEENANQKEACIASLIAALSSPQMEKIVTTVTPIPNDITSLYYILKQPLYFNRQQVELSGVLSLQVSQIVNTFLNDKSAQSNPLAVSEEDIQHLLNIINFLSESGEVPVKTK